MSRCFPYPPPGYVKDGISDEALIESIKLQREGEKAKKEKRREKKEEKARENKGHKSKKHGHKKRHRYERNQDLEQGGCKRSRHNEAESIERSSLTEEHGQPVGSQNSTDSTLNSSKKHKQTLLPGTRHNSGSIFRIRLPLQRHKDPEMLPSKEQPSSVLGRTDDASVQRMYEPDPVPGKNLGDHSGSTSGQELTLRLNKAKSSPSLEVSESSGLQGKSDLGSNLCGSCSPRLAIKFRDLVENWVTPQLQSPELDNQDWLFESRPKQNPNSGVAVRDAGGDGSSHGNSTPWPCVCYLPEADVYALPFTVPF